MALYRIRPSSVYVDSTKVATVSDGQLDLASGDESQIADGGYVGHSDGAITSKLKVNRVVPVSGEGSKLLVAFKSKKYVRVKVATLEGKIFDIEMRITALGYSWEHKGGTNKGSTEFEGGDPNLTG